MQKFPALVGYKIIWLQRLFLKNAFSNYKFTSLQRDALIDKFDLFKFLSVSAVWNLGKNQNWNRKSSLSCWYIRRQLYLEGCHLLLVLLGKQSWMLQHREQLLDLGSEAQGQFIAKEIWSFSLWKIFNTPLKVFLFIKLIFRGPLNSFKQFK